MKAEAMTNRERILATCHQQEVDRYPVWQKLANPTWKNTQPEPYRSMDGVELLKETGCDVMTWAGGARLKKESRVTIRKEEKGNQHITIYETPDGDLTGIEAFDEVTRSTHPIKYPVETKEDMEKARWIYKDTVYEVDLDSAKECVARQKRMEENDVVTNDGIGPGPFMMCIEHLIGPVNTVYLQMDEPELFNELQEEMHQDRLRELRAKLPHTPSDTFWMTENTSTSLLSPTQFRENCMPHLKEYGQMILDNDIIPVHHMCGTLNALLEMIDELPAMVNEAYTTSPLGDVSLAEGRKRMPSKALIGGTNATLWLEEPDVIVESVAKDLAECENKRGIFLTSAGVLPPLVPVEKVKIVNEQLKKL